MKYILSTIAAILCLNCFAGEISILKGTWKRESDGEIKLYRIISGHIEPMTTYKLQPDAKFSFAFEPTQEGFYVLGSGHDESQVDKYLFYIKPGEQVQMDVNDSTYVFGGKVTPENQAYAAWHEKAAQLEYKSVYFMQKWGWAFGSPSTFVDFFPLLEEIAGQSATYKPKTNNPVFDRQFEYFRTYDLLRYASQMIFTPRSVHPEIEDYTPFYSKIDIPQLTRTASLLDYPFGKGVLMNISYLRMMREKIRLDGTAELDYILSQVANDSLKGEPVLNYAQGFKTYDTYASFIEKYNKYIISDNQKERRDAIANEFLNKRETITTIDFSGTTTKGDTVRLSDLIGKVVFVDIWATWCGPCKSEIPALKKLEEHYTGKDVVFMSISVDEVKDKQKWLDFVNKENLTGLQLFGGAGWKSDVARFYNVNAIPRFLLFGKDGAIVTDDAPRPSDSQIKELIDNHLQP